MLNKRGFSAVELLAAFSLAAIMIFIISEITIFLRAEYNNINARSEIALKQSIILHKIGTDFNNFQITSISACGDDCFEIDFSEQDMKILKIDGEENTFQYGNYATEIEENIVFGTILLENETFTPELENKIDSFLKIEIPLSHNYINDQNFDIIVIYQYDNNANPITFIME